MKKTICVFVLFVCFVTMAFAKTCEAQAEKVAERLKPIPGTEQPLMGMETPMKEKDPTEGQWEVFADDKGELKNMALESAEYDNRAVSGDSMDDMEQFSRSVIDEEVESGRDR